MKLGTDMWKEDRAKKPWELRTDQEEDMIQNMTAPQYEFARHVRDFKRRMEHAERIARLLIDNLEKATERNGVVYALEFANDDALMNELIRKEAVHEQFQDWVLKTVRATFIQTIKWAGLV